MKLLGNVPSNRLFLTFILQECSVLRGSYIGCNDVGQIEYVQDRDRGRAFINTAIKFSGSMKGEGGNFLINCATISFRKTVFHKLKIRTFLCIINFFISFTTNDNCFLN